MIKNKKIVIGIMGIVIVCSIAITIGIYAKTTGKTLLPNKDKMPKNESLAENFDNIFTNKLIADEKYSEIVKLKYDYHVEENGKYTIDTKIPNLNIKSENAEKINAEIYDIFIIKLIDVLTTDRPYTTYNISYIAYVNNDILSLVIKCLLKEGTNAQRLIIKTYNYDLKNEKIVTLKEILDSKGLKEDDVQKQIKDKIEEEIKGKEELLTSEGYNIYLRNKYDSMYKIENTTEYFLGEDNYLYIVYPYGNKNYTITRDVIVL